MIEIKCPYDLNQFILGEPIFENTFSEEECEQRKFYGDCYHCFSTAIVSRDQQIKQENSMVLDEIRNIISKWKNDSWTDGLSYECMVKISNLLEESEG